MRIILSLAVAAALCVAAVSAGFYDAKTSNVVNLTPANFDKEVLQSEDLWLIEFYAPWCGHCKRLTPDWEQAAKTLKGSVKIGAVDADAHRELGSKYNVQGFPTIKVFGTDKTKPSDYEGGRSAQNIADYAKRQLKNIQNRREGKPDEPEEPKKDQAPPADGFYTGTDVVELTDATFESEVVNGKEPWLIEFYAPWCGHCKNLVPAWKAAAAELVGAVKIGAIDATAHTKFSGKYNVQGFPTIKFFAPGKSEAPEDYNGGRNKEDIVAYCNKKAEEYPSTPPNVGQILNNKDLAERCEKKTLCVVFIVPHVMDTGAAGREDLIKRFGEVAGKVRARSVAVGWIAGGEHTSFEESFGIFSTYPTFAAINFKNLRAATHKGSFSTDALVASIKKVLDGKSAITQLKALPKLREDVPAWDGKDYVPPADDE